MYILNVKNLHTGKEQRLEFESARQADIYKKYHLEFGHWNGLSKWVRESLVLPEQLQFICDEMTEVENGSVIRYYKLSDGIIIQGELVTTPKTVLQAYQLLRFKRNQMLLETDWTQLADVLMSQDDRKSYRAYRTYLRTLPTLHDEGSIAGAVVYNYKEWLEGKR